MAQTNNRKSAELCAAFTAMAIVVGAGILLTVGFLWSADRIGPETGDIIAFPATRVPSVSTASFAVRRAVATDTTSYILDAQTMKSGGSLVVEGSRFKLSRIFGVHSAGARTSSDLTISAVRTISC